MAIKPKNMSEDEIRLAVGVLCGIVYAGHENSLRQFGLSWAETHSAPGWVNGIDFAIQAGWLLRTDSEPELFMLTPKGVKVVRKIRGPLTEIEGSQTYNIPAFRTKHWTGAGLRWFTTRGMLDIPYFGYLVDPRFRTVEPVRLWGDVWGAITAIGSRDRACSAPLWRCGDDRLYLGEQGRGLKSVWIDGLEIKGRALLTNDRIDFAKIRPETPLAFFRDLVSFEPTRHSVLVIPQEF